MQVSTNEFAVRNVKMPEGKLHCIFHGEQDFLQRLHLLHQHGLLNMDECIQATIVVGVLKQLIKTQSENQWRRKKENKSGG